MIFENVASTSRSDEGDHKGFLTLNQHLLAATAAPHGLAALSGFGRSPLRKIAFQLEVSRGC